MLEFTRAEAAHLRDAVVMVKHHDTIGTAFFIGPGQLLTCEHVVRGAQTHELSIQWSGRELPVHELILPPKGSDLDAALLIVGVHDHPIVELGPSKSAVAPVYAYGFQFIERGYYGYPAFGSLAGTVREGNDEQGRELLHIITATISPGLSGAPLYSLVDSKVVAIVKRDRPEGGGYAIPIEQIGELRSDLLSAAAANRARASGDKSALAAYFKQLCAEHEYVSLMDLQRSLKLDEIFVSLTLTKGGVTGSQLSLTTGGGVSVSSREGAIMRNARRDKGSPQRFGGEQPESLFDLLSHQKVIVIGEPGAGKTTLLRHLARRICKGELVRDRIPLLVRLADLEVSVGCIERWVQVTQPAASDQLLQSMKAGECLLLLDGFDEVRRSSQPQLAREVERLSAAGNQTLLSCRSVSFPRGLFSSDFRTLECIGFNPSQQRRFLRQWFKDTPNRATELEKQIAKHPGVLGFARNPLLLSLMAVVTENEHEFKLPIHRTELYDKALRVLLERRSSYSRSDLSVRRKLSILRHLASAHFSRGEEIFSEEDVLQEIERHFPPGNTGADPEKVLNDFLEADGILSIHSPQHYRFLHLTFQEFLTAQNIIQSGDVWAKLERFLDAPRWEEVIRLTCGLLPDPNATLLIQRLRVEKSSVKHFERLLLAARACSDCPQLTSDLHEEIASELVTAASRNDQPGQLAEAEDALASLARAHCDLMERIIVPFASSSASQGPLLSTTSLIRLLGLVADPYSTGVLRSLWDQRCDPAAAGEGDLEVERYVLEAIGRAGLEDLAEPMILSLESPSTFVATACARSLIELQPLRQRDLLLGRLKNITGSGRILCLAVLFSLNDPLAVSQAFEAIFGTSDYDVQKAFAYYFNRSEVDLDPGAVGAVYDQTVSPHTLGHLYSMYRCFLHPALFAKLRAAAVSAEIDLSLRCVAITSLLRLDGESLTSLLQVAAAALEEGRPEVLRAVIAGTPTSASEALGRSLSNVLDERKRAENAAPILRFALSNRVTSLRAWIERLATSEDLEPTTARMAMLALAAVGSPVFLNRAVPTLRDLSVAGIPNRILIYRGLGLLANRQSRELLTSHLQVEADRAVVAEIIRALGRHRGEDTAKTLVQLLDPACWPSNWPPPDPPRVQGDQQPSDRRRLSLIFALQQLMSPHALPALISLSANSKEDSSIRDAALIAARNIGWGVGLRTGESTVPEMSVIH